MTKTSASLKDGAADSHTSETSQETEINASIGMALTLAWQLAVVVLVPVVLGQIADRAFGTLPVLSLIGLLVATLGIVVVVRQTLRQVNKEIARLPGKHEDKDV